MSLFDFNFFPFIHLLSKLHNFPILKEMNYYPDIFNRSSPQKLDMTFST